MQCSRSHACRYACTPTQVCTATGCHILPPHSPACNTKLVPHMTHIGVPICTCMCTYTASRYFHVPLKGGEWGLHRMGSPGCWRPTGPFLMKMTPPSLLRNRSERMGWERGSTALHTECTFGNTHPLTLGQLRVRSFCLPPQGMLRPHCTDRKHGGLNLQQWRQADHVQVSGCPRGVGEENGARAVLPQPQLPRVRLRSQSPPPRPQRTMGIPQALLAGPVAGRRHMGPRPQMASSGEARRCLCRTLQAVCAHPASHQPKPTLLTVSWGCQVVGLNEF